jgi:hypothetical protein
MHAKHFIIAGAVALGATLGVAEADSITTRDGITYTNAVVQRADPDGVVIEYAPRPGSIGIAKLKFARLSDELRRRYNYDATDALIFEQNHAAGIARRQEEIAEGDIEKRRVYDALWQQRADEEAALEAERQEAAANEAAQMQNGGWYGGYDGAWYAMGNKRYRHALRGPLTSLDSKKCSTSDQFAHWPYSTGDLGAHYATGGVTEQHRAFASRNPVATGKPPGRAARVAAGRPAAAGNPGARGFSARSH